MGSTVAKYAAAGAILGSLFALTVMGDMKHSEYVQLAELVLAALGGFHAGRFQGGGQ